MDTQAPTWQQLLSRVAADPRALPEPAHQVLATCSDPAVRDAWAARRDLPAALLADRARDETDARVLARLVAQPHLARDLARATADGDGGRWTSLAFALRLDCPDREGAARVDDAGAGAAGLRAVEVVAGRVGPLPDGRRHTRRALLGLLGRDSSGRDLAVLPQAASKAEHALAADAIVRPGLPYRRLLRHVCVAEHPDAARLVDDIASPPPSWDSSLEAWARLNSYQPDAGPTGRRVALRLAATARTRRMRDHLAPDGDWATLPALLANPLVTGAERTRLVGTAGPAPLAGAVADPAVLHRAADLEQLRAAARRNGKAVRSLAPAHEVDRLPARDVVSPTAAWPRRRVDLVAVTARLAALDWQTRETVLALLADWDGTVGELVELSAVL